MANDALLIFSLRALNDPAEAACLLSQNSERCVRASTEDMPELPSRESTPIFVESRQRAEIRFELTKPPKSLQRGYTFGSDLKRCDVVLGRKIDGISGRHFSVDFDGDCQLILTDSSSIGTEFCYGGQRSIRRNFSHVLFDDKEIIVKVMDMEFQISLPDRTTSPRQQTDYENALSSYLEARLNASPPLHLLNVESLENTLVPPSRSDYPTSNTLYWIGPIIGKGAFSTVHKVTDASTGRLYAAKRPAQLQDTSTETLSVMKRFAQSRPLFLNELNMARKVFHVSFALQLTVMKITNRKPHIVEYFPSVEQDSQSFLIMDYLPLGDLRTQHKSYPMTKEDSMQVLHQGLLALTYLHSLQIVHRDLKPENLLVENRQPIRIKLTDFGLAKQSFFLKSRVGTPL